MSTVLKHLLTALPLFVLTGCAALAGLLGGGGGATASPTSAPPPSFWDEVEYSTQINLMAPAALIDGSTRVEADVIQDQCRFGTANPPYFVPTVDAQKNCSFTGRLNVDHQPS